MKRPYGIVYSAIPKRFFFPKGVVDGDGEGPFNFPSEITFSFTTCSNSQSLLLSDCFKGLPKKQNIIPIKPTLS